MKEIMKYMQNFTMPWASPEALQIFYQTGVEIQERGVDKNTLKCFTRESND